MRVTAPGLRAVLLAFAATLFLPVSTWAQSILIDLNGDGIRDRIAVEYRPDEVIVRLGQTDRVLRLRAPEAVDRLAAVDIDRDGDSDIVASTQGPSLHVWMNHGRGRFVPATRPVATRFSIRELRSGAFSPAAAQADEPATAERDLTALLARRSDGRAVLEAARQPSRPRAPARHTAIRLLVPRGPPALLA